MRAYVTGATGFIGGRLADRLLRDGHDLAVLARTPAKAEGLVERGARLVQGDVTDDPGALATGMEDADVVFHLAAIYEIGPEDPSRLERVNVGGTRNILEAAREAGVATTVYCSTAAALGPTGRGERADEDHLEEFDGEFTTPYERTKNAAHRLAESYAADGMDVRIGCPTLVYGPGDTSDMALNLKFLVRGMLPAVPFAESELTFVHVEDVAAGLVRIAESGEPGRSYIIGGEIARNLDMYRMAAELAGRRPPSMKVPDGVLRAIAPLTRPAMRALGRPPKLLEEGLEMLGGGQGWAYRSDRAEQELGYRYRSLAEGLPETVEWARREPLRA